MAPHVVRAPQSAAIRDPQFADSAPSLWTIKLNRLVHMLPGTSRGSWRELADAFSHPYHRACGDVERIDVTTVGSEDSLPVYETRRGVESILREATARRCPDSTSVPIHPVEDIAVGRYNETTTVRQTDRRALRRGVGSLIEAVLAPFQRWSCLRRDTNGGVAGIKRVSAVLHKEIIDEIWVSVSKRAVADRARAEIRACWPVLREVVGV